ncbi:MAG TPA: hypothetical protein VMU37_07835 [Caulobacteraceae bacterium]|nr:hypothetical protein [Caulobacteraceae bacterium]
MSGRDQEGWDWMPASATAAQISSLMNMTGWYFSTTNLPNSQLVSPGRFGYGQALRPNGVNLAQFSAVKPIGGQNSAGGWVSVGYKTGPANNFAAAFVGVFDAVNNQVLATVSFEQNGVIKAWRGWPGANLLGASEPGVYLDTVWEDIEAFFKVGATGGEILVRVNTGSVLSLINVDTQPGANAYFDSYCFGFYYPGGATTADFYLDDLRYYDMAGTINNTWLGTCRVQTCLPTANGATTDFTRSNTSLANWQNIANQNVDDTLYLSDANAGDFNLSAVEPLVNSPVVAWVGVTSFLRQDDATQITAKNRIVSGSTTADGAAYLTAQTYAADTDVFETDPATGVQFTGAGVNALQIGPLVFAIA